MHLFKKEKTTKIKIAYFISRLSDPVTWLVPLGILVIYHSESTGSKQWLWFVGFLLFLAILPGILILAKLKKKKVSDIDFTNRKERTPVYVAVIILWAIGLIITETFSGPNLIMATLLAGEIMAIIILFINLKWKISNHGFISSVVPIFLGTFVNHHWYWLFLWIPLVGWSRVVQKKHTIAQVLAGAALGFIYLVVLKIFGY